LSIGGHDCGQKSQTRTSDRDPPHDVTYDFAAEKRCPHYAERGSDDAVPCDPRAPARARARLPLLSRTVLHVWLASDLWTG
jgi:hypothetical protein